MASHETSSSQTIIHTFNDPGDYNISLTAEDSRDPIQNTTASLVVRINADILNNTNSTSPAAVTLQNNNTNSPGPAVVDLQNNNTNSTSRYIGSIYCKSFR